MSNLTSGSSQANLDEHPTPFACDFAVVTPMIGDRVLIQVGVKSDTRARTISFGGRFSDPRLVDVDRVYLNDGTTLETTKGLCRIFRGEVGQYKSFVCGARIERDDIAIATVVAFETTQAPKSRR
jgi:hypothetical protein